MTAQQRAWAHGAGLPPAGGRPSTGRVRFTGVLLILGAAIFAVLCWLAFTTWLPADRERYRDYRAAEPCPAHATARQRAHTDCVGSEPFTVVKTVIKDSGKTTTYRATLKDGESWQGDVDFGDPGPLLEHLKPGDRATATVWRREIMTLSRGGVRQNTSDAPRDELQMNAAMGMGAALIAAQAFVFGAVRLARPRAHGNFVWNPYGRRLLFSLIALPFAVGLPAVWLGVPWWIVPIVGVPVAAGATKLCFSV